MLRSSCLFVAVLAQLLAIAACDPPATVEIALPDGVAVIELPPAQQDLLRVTLEVSGGALAETEATLDVAAGTVGGDFALQNVAASDERTATLRLYGRFDAESDEVLLGQTQSTLTVTPAVETRLSFTEPFETCGAGLDEQCALAFDENRNKKSNVLDLLPVAASGLGIDPAPQATFVEVSPSTLQFPSGIRLGSFARQVIVLENRGAHPMRVLRAEVVGGQGVGLALFDLTGADTQAPRRILDSDAFGEGGGVIAPTDEAFIAVSFAPANLFFTTGAVQLAVQDTVTFVTQTARVKIIANPEGGLRSPGDYDAPELGAALAVAEGQVGVSAFPTGPLFSGLAITGAATEAGGLARTGAVLLSEDGDGTAFAMPADAAFAVDVPAGHRFSTSLGGLASDVDLAVFTVDGDGDNAVITGLACATCFSSHAGASPESAELTNESDEVLRVVVVLGRVDDGPVLADFAEEGALVAAPPLVDFDLTAHVTKGPEFADDAPVSPSDGPLEGGVPVTLRGRGFDERATVTFADAVALDVVIENDAQGNSTVTLTLPPGSLEVGKNPATIVVLNPAADEGGDGQAATLPNGFTYQPPAPRVTAVSPGFATTSGSELPIVIEGTFFSTRAGPPVVTFGAGDGAIAVDAVFESPARILVNAPALPEEQQGEPRTVALTVQNRLEGDALAGGAARLGAPSNAREFRFVVPVGPAPSVATVSPNNGGVEGGDAIVVTGTGFRAGATVLVDGVLAVTAAPTEGGTRLQATTPARSNGSAGAVDVVVVNDDGQSGALDDAFSYVIAPPSVASVFPDRAVIDGGTLLVVTGSGFREGARVTFDGGGGAPVSAASVTRVSSTTLLVLTPSAPEGDAALVITNDDEQSVSFDDFAFFEAAGPPPEAVGVDPASGDVGGGFAVSVFGEDFSADASVVFGGVLLDGDALTIELGAGGGFDRITFDAPAASSGNAGIVAVQVVNSDQQSDGVTFSYVVAPAAPRIDRVEPSRVSSTTSTPLTIRGANLGDVVQVFAAGLPIPFAVSSSLELTATVPPSPVGLLALSVQTAGGKVASTTLEVVGVPTIVGLSTDVVHAAVAGDQLLVFGENLDAAALSSVNIGGQAANVLVVDQSFLLVELPTIADTPQAELTLVYQGGGSAVSPPFSARSPRVVLVETAGPDGTGRLTLSLFGDFLNAERLRTVHLTTVIGDVECVVESKSEASIVCVNEASLDFGAQYGVRLDYEALFDGTTTPVQLPQPFVCSSSGCSAQ